MNKTQVNIVCRIVNINPYNRGSLKEGWTSTIPMDKSDSFITLMKLNEGDQALKLAEKYPDVFSADMKAWRVINFKVLNDLKARELLKRYQK